LPAVAVHAGDRLRHEFSLELGDRSEVIVVSDTAGGPQLESAEIKDLVRQEEVVTFPLRERKFLDLAMLTEGVVRPPGGTRGEALQQACSCQRTAARSATAPAW